jgi:5-methyltetrahydrofolate--homocysteine methyltransferase
MPKTLLETLCERPLLGNGAMGMQLMLAGLVQGNWAKEWHLTHADRVAAIQRRYAEAGSDCIRTNTFGGSSCCQTSGSGRQRPVAQILHILETIVAPG